MSRLYVPQGKSESKAKKVQLQIVRDAAWRPAAEKLVDTDLLYVNAAWLNAYLMPAEQQSLEMKTMLRQSDELVAEPLAANHLAIGCRCTTTTFLMCLKA